MPVLEEDVGWLKIAVYDVVAGEVLASLGDLIDDITPFHGLVILCVFLEIASLTVLSDDIAVIGSVLDVYEFDDVLVIEFLHDVDLIVEEVDVGDVHFFEFDDLDGVPLMLDVVLDALVDLAAVPAADEVIEVEAVAPDALLAGVHGLYLLSIALLHVHRTVSIHQLDLLCLDAGLRHTWPGTVTAYCKIITEGPLLNKFTIKKIGQIKEEPGRDST